MRFSPILSGYIGRQFAAAFATVLSVIVGLILLFDLIELLRRAAGREGVSFTVVLGMALLKLPQMVHVILPFAVMIGAMVALWRLTRSAELVVARAAGVSVWQLLTPVLSLVFIVGVLEVTAFNPFASALYARYERLQDSLLLRQSNPLAFSQGGLWLREQTENRQSVVYAGLVRQEGFVLKLRDVTILHLDGADHFVDRVDAGGGTLADGFFHLQDVWLMKPGRHSEHLDEISIKTSLTLSKIQDNFASPEAISFWELPGFIDFFESAGFSAHRQKLYWHSLMASPLLLCGMALVAAMVSIKPNMRSGGLMFRIAFGVTAGFLFYFFSKVVYALGLSMTLPLSLAAWSPPAVVSLVGLASLFHQEDG
ncbi:MAG: LPS export ABC transporter permease LptG [Rhodospirillales bacterium]|nr:LPS export ABC transporter permease LptG [Rhodospirillales bacterium]